MLVPLGPGILLGRIWVESPVMRDSAVATVGGFACVVLLCGVLCMLSYAGEPGISLMRMKKNTVFGVSVCVFFFLFGMWRSASEWYRIYAGVPDGERSFVAVLTDTPRYSERTVTAEAFVTLCDDSLQAYKANLIFLRDSLSGRLTVGDRVVCRAVLYRPKNRGNPDEFDYAGYLMVKGVSLQAFLPSGRWHAVSSEEGKCMKLPWMVSLRVRALQWRERMLAFYRTAGLQGDTFALWAALTLGAKSSLSRELRDLYAETGVSHVLALSGMHLGILMMCFHALFVRCRQRKVLQGCVGIIALWLMWLYVFVAGLPASLVRSATMYTFMWTAVLCGRRGLSFHALMVSAFLMLCIHPSYLYDTGFRLSFLAMTGILTVYPSLDRLDVMRGRAGWLFRSLGLSLSAQLFTFPLTAYCFGVFSPYSVWASLVVSPLVALLLLAMPLLLVVGSLGVPVLVAMLVSCVEGLVCLQHWFLRGLSSFPFATLDVTMPRVAMCVSYVLLAVMLMRRYFSIPGWLKVICSMCSLLVVVWGIEYRMGSPAPCVVFYNVPSCPAVHVVESPRTSYLFTAAALPEERRMASVKRTFWRKRLKVPPVTVSGDYRDHRVTCVSGWVGMKCGVSFLMLYDARWNQVSSTSAVVVDYILLCHGFRGRLDTVATHFRPQLVVLDASLRAGERKRYMRQCEALGWRFYDMETQGALKVSLK